ncbi:hypothetical protein [Desulfolucanica intricata]|uniref:hypothetical protein n=1 Tax=Desulfolucanica intricata TaxID=1285191 RepID=UPI0009EE5507|nr:hypothetical protein [Desulfolucanica intricata]
MTKKENHQDILARSELLAFFQANPHTRDTAYGLASRLNRSSKRIKTACDILVGLGVLQTNCNTKNKIYSLKNKEILRRYS